MLDWLFELSQTSPVAHALGLLTIVCAAGMAVGSIRWKKVGLGSSAVLFVGILAGQWSDPIDPQTLHFVKEFGLVLFVFTLGLQLGPGFFASLRADGLKLNVLATLLVIFAGGLAPLVGWLAEMDSAAVPGLFAGASTNTPALGAAQQSLAAMPGVTRERQALTALACAVSYPAAVAATLAVVLVVKMLFRIDPVKEAAAYAAQRRQLIQPILRRTIVVDRPEMWETLRRADDPVVISRLRPAGAADVQTAHRDYAPREGDTVLAVGTSAALDRFERAIGHPSDEDLMAAPGKITFRRIVVTHRRALGKTIAELAFEPRLGVEVTRIMRGDVEMTAVPSLRLQFGDVLQIVGPDEQLTKAAELLGNSLKKLNETQFIPLFAGIFLGVLAGSIPLAIPGLSSPVRLGLAGGPLIVALVLGRIGHLGGMVWHMPLNANHAFREFGIALFFAALGLTAGDQFFAAVFSPRGLTWLIGGMIVSLVPLATIAVWCRAVEKMNFVTLAGLLAGGTTNPPALSFANSLCGSDAPALAYATVYPVTTLLRILVAQVLTLALCG